MLSNLKKSRFCTTMTLNGWLYHYHSQHKFVDQRHLYPHVYTGSIMVTLCLNFLPDHPFNLHHNEKNIWWNTSTVCSRLKKCLFATTSHWSRCEERSSIWKISRWLLIDTEKYINHYWKKKATIELDIIFLVFFFSFTFSYVTAYSYLRIIAAGVKRLCGDNPQNASVNIWPAFVFSITASGRFAADKFPLAAILT